MELTITNQEERLPSKVEEILLPIQKEGILHDRFFSRGRAFFQRHCGQRRYLFDYTKEIPKPYNDSDLQDYRIAICVVCGDQQTKKLPPVSP